MITNPDVKPKGGLKMGLMLSNLSNRVSGKLNSLRVSRTVWLRGGSDEPAAAGARHLLAARQVHHQPGIEPSP